jgi:copper chaperone CopZ
MTTTTIKTTGMYCPSCPMLIELSLGDLPGVGSVRASNADCETVVTFDESVIALDTILNEIRNAGYGAECAA